MEFLNVGLLKEYNFLAQFGNNTASMAFQRERRKYFGCADELMSTTINDVAHMESTLQIIVTPRTPEFTF
jgi:hypothetical protein